MSKIRAWVLGVVTVMLVVVVAGYTVGISPVFAAIAEANGQLTTTEVTNQSSQKQLGTLKTQFDNIRKVKAKLKTLQLSIPEAQAASAFIDELTVLSADTGVTLQSVTIASATLYAAPADAPAAAGSTVGGASATPAPSPTASAAITPAATAPTTTASGLVLIPVTVAVKGTFEATRLFVGALQAGQRLVAVSGVTMTTNSTEKTVLASVAGYIFTLQGTSDLALKAKGTPTPTPTPTPTATAAASGSTSRPTATPSPTRTP